MASALAAALKKKPSVPVFKKVDIGAEQETGVREMEELLPSLAAFAEQFNQFSSEQMMAQLERMLPGYAQLLAQGTENIQAMMRGEVPDDVQDQLERQAAERGVTLGYGGGSGFGQNQFLRNFGLTSLQLTQQGLNSAMNWMNQAASRAPVFNMASAFLPIDQRVALRAQENQFQFQRDWLKAKVKAIPSGGRAFAITALDEIQELAFSALKMYMGGAMGGMGGGGGGQSAPPVTDAWQGGGFDAGVMQSRAWSPTYTGSAAPATSWATPGMGDVNNFTPAGPAPQSPSLYNYQFPGTFG